MDPELFVLDPNPPLQQRDALAACGRCTVRGPCLAEALARRDYGSIRGGVAVANDGAVVDQRRCPRCRRWFAPYRTTRKFCDDECARRGAR
jgi:hypothetical protein